MHLRNWTSAVVGKWFGSECYRSLIAQCIVGEVVIGLSSHCGKNCSITAQLFHMLNLGEVGAVALFLVDCCDFNRTDVNMMMHKNNTGVFLIL